MNQSSISAAAIAALFALAAPLSAQTVGTIVIAHGGSAEWNAPVLDIARQAQTGGPVEVALLMGEFAPQHRFQDAVARLIEQGAERIVAVPLLASSHSGHYDQIRYLAGELPALSESMMHHLEMAGIERPATEVPITVTHSIDASMEIATILSERALALANDASQQALYIVGHGPNSAEDHAEWMANLRPVADSIARATGFRDVKIGLVRDDAPDAVRAEAVRSIREVIELQRELTGQPVVVVPVLISNGYVSQKLRRDLAGLDIAFDGNGLLPHAQLARWIERRVREAPVQETAQDTASRGAAPSGAREAATHRSAPGDAPGEHGAH
ncbi:MAG TPA: CbiX/SirB N-terminal domain-containing protein [Thermoanaerobaculia bacterium]